MLHHGDQLGCIAPGSNISQSEAHTSSKSSGGIHLNHSLKGLLLVIQISCSTTLVQPNSFPSSIKVSCKARRRSHAATAFLGVQLLRPSRFNFSRSFFCYTATYMGSRSASVPRMASISGDSSVCSTSNAETTLATHTPFLRKIGDADMFLTTTDTLLVLILSLVYVCRTCNPGGRGHVPPGWDS